MKNFIYMALLLFLLAASCRKPKTVPIPLTELEKLPSITQTGANTFGFLLNGQAWLPNGRSASGSSNPRADIDYNYAGGQFQIRGGQFNLPYANSFTFNLTSVRSIGEYFFKMDNKGIRIVRYLKPLSCDYVSSDVSSFVDGSIIITKYDIVAGIYAGTFDFKLFNPTSGCGADTLRITNGRFDIKL